jgi:DNA mismatch endonuclease (patch repair protein)
MPDLYSVATRSYVMSRIRGRNTKPEVLLRQALWVAGLRGYRTHGALPGRPDIVLTRVRLAVFVDGCFWHSCPKCRIPAPTSRTAYWQPKLRRNKVRDQRVTRELRRLGWTPLRLWEHEVQRDSARSAARVVRAVARLERVAG